MKLRRYVLFLGVIIIKSVTFFLSCEAAPITNNDLPSVNNTFLNTKETGEDTEVIRIRKDEFDEIVGQLQGMKTLMEKMKQDYDTRFQELQKKIAILEKEKMNPSSSHGSSVSQQSESRETASPSLNTTSTAQQTAAAGNRQMPFPNNAKVADQTTSSSTGQWSPAQPLTLLSSGKNYMNISFDGLFAAGGSTVKDLESIETGGHDPLQRGFTVQNLETVFEGAIDPYFKGQSNIIFQIDKDGESFMEVEEAYLTSMSLPANLQIKAGTFFTEFGRLNQFHPHAWDFADQPLVNGRFLGPDGLRNPGMRLSWLAPTDNYTELFITVQDSQGETAYSFRNPDALFVRDHVDTGVRNLGDMLYVPRVATSFDLTDEQTVVLGSSAAFGPNSTGNDEDTIIYGLDIFWKWKSPYASGGFPFVTWQTEVMGRRFEAGEYYSEDKSLPDEVMNNWGAYSQISWGFKKRWVTAIRGDYVDGEEGAGDATGLERWRLSPNLTFFPSEFSKIRLQYNYDDILKDRGTEHSVFLQFEFLLGSHAAHKF